MRDNESDNTNEETNVEITIKRTRIIGTSTVVYSAWTPAAYSGPYSTVTSIGGRPHGRLGTEFLSDSAPELDALPAGRERSRKVRAWQDDRYQAAYSAILAEYPGLSGRPMMGEIETEESA